MGNKDESIGGYGTVIEHPFIRGIFYMVIRPNKPNDEGFDFWAVVLRDDSGLTQKQVPGEVILCGGYYNKGISSDWLIRE